MLDGWGEAVERGGLERCVEEFWALEPAGPPRGAAGGLGEGALSYVLDPEHSAFLSIHATP